MVQAIGRVRAAKNRVLRRRVVALIVAHVIFGFANALLRLSGQGNDPSTAMVLALGNRLGLSLTAMSLIVYGLYFMIQFRADRSLVGVGTFINWVFVGVLTDACYALYQRCLPLPPALTWRLGATLASIVLFSLAASLYQTAALGISPYDSLSIALSRKAGLPYTGCRILTDSLNVLLCASLGGVLGVGTLICAVGIGPIIAFFNRNVSQRLIGINSTAAQERMCF